MNENKLVATITLPRSDALVVGFGDVREEFFTNGSMTFVPSTSEDHVASLKTSEPLGTIQQNKTYG